LWRGAPCPVRRVCPDVETRQQEQGADLAIETVTPVGSLRIVYRRSEQGNTGFLIEHPLKSKEDFRILTWVEEHTRFDDNSEAVEEHFAGNGREGLSLGMLHPLSKTAFQYLVEHGVGTEELIYALVDYPEVVENLLAVMQANNLKAVRMAAESDYDYFITWEDSSTQNYSPTQYEAYVAPEITSYCDILGEHGKHYIQHACGHVEALLPIMKRCGVLAVESLSPQPTGNISLREARRMVGDRMGIIGGIEPTHLLSLPDDQLDDYVMQVLEDGSSGPFVVANADSCPPGVTPERFKRLASLVHGKRAV
jgi:uroporphyrinogen-III decarboxylase